MPTFLELPTEVLAQVASFLDLSSLIHLSQSNRVLSRVIGLRLRELCLRNGIYRKKGEKWMVALMNIVDTAELPIYDYDADGGEFVGFHLPMGEFAVFDLRNRKWFFHQIVDPSDLSNDIGDATEDEKRPSWSCRRLNARTGEAVFFCPETTEEPGWKFLRIGRFQMTDGPRGWGADAVFFRDNAVLANVHERRLAIREGAFWSFQTLPGVDPVNAVSQVRRGGCENIFTINKREFFFLHNIADGKKICLPSPDSIYPFKRRLKFLKRALNHLLVDDMFIELTDSKLGQGAVGFVFKGYVYPKTQTRFKQKTFAAVKKSLGLLEEAARMARLDHPNIVKIIAVSKLSFSAFRPMFAMEWLPGGSLAEYFRDQIRRKEERDREQVFVRDILHVLRQVSEALKYIHESRDQEGNEFTHGDVAARNILLNHRSLSTCVAKLGDFGLPIDFGPRLPIPWLPPEIVCSLDRSNPIHRPESDVWMFGVLAWECSTLGAEPHYQRTYDEITQCFQLPDRGLAYPPSCPREYWSLLMDCLSEQHRRPKFSGSTDSNTSVIHRIANMEAQFEHSQQQFHMVLNVSNCTCAQHRCNVPLPQFTIR